MPAKNVEKVRMKMRQTFHNIEMDKAPQAVMTALIIGGSMSALMTPMDTGTLVNSQYRNLEKVPKGWQGRFGYTASYAAAVHSMPGKLKGRPRSSVASFEASGGRVGFESNTGNFWDPQGEPQFLVKGFEDARADIDVAVRREMAL